VGQFEAARPWFERAVAEAEKGDVHGRVDHESLRLSLHNLANCFQRLGRDEDAKRWEARRSALDP
jgi:hypothetical protein